MPRLKTSVPPYGGANVANYFEMAAPEQRHLRGRTADEMINLLVEGINESKTHDIPVKILHHEAEAIQYAYDNVRPGAIITIMCDVIPDALDQIKKLKEAEDKM